MARSLDLILILGLASPVLGCVRFEFNQWSRALAPIGKELGGLHRTAGLFVCRTRASERAAQAGSAAAAAAGQVKAPAAAADDPARLGDTGDTSLI